MCPQGNPPGALPVSRIFISHSSANNAEAIALRDWMVAEGWSDLFLDLDPDRGIAAGERWERALNEAARRCEAVLFLISKAWLASRWCMNELTLARRLNKRLFGVLVQEGLTVANLPHDVTTTWQLVNLATGRDHQQFRVTLPVTGEEVHVTYSHEGLSRLKAGLQRAGLHASYFAWPPESDPKRAPYRGLRPMEADDAGIFFGREAPVIEAIDRLRGLAQAPPPRLMAILGASGAGKSSFLRAGMLPRLGRDPQTFLPLPVIRPERSAMSGETGLVSALAVAFEGTSLKVARGEIREAVSGGATKLKPLLARLLSTAQPPEIDGGSARMPPTLVIAIDQGEELFLAEAQDEAQPFLALLRDLVVEGAPPVIAVFTIRSDNYERLQSAPELDGVHQEMLNLPPMPKGSFAEVIKGPIRRLDGSMRAIKLDDSLSDALLADIEAGGAKDALPLLAFTLGRLYGEFGAIGHLTLDHYIKLGRIKGSIAAAVERAFEAADGDNRIPRDRESRLTLLRRGLIPWLAGIDPDTKAPRRRVARLSEIPAEARPLIDLLVEQRLLSTDVAQDTGETTIEPAHEALLRQWGLLQGWLSDDTGLLTLLDDIKRAARDWAANAKASSWLAHGGDRLRAAERLMARPDLAANLEPTDQMYLAACQWQVRSERMRARRTKWAMSALAASVCGVAVLAYFKIIDPANLEGVYNGARNRMADASLLPGDSKRDCGSEACPEMVVLPLGEYMMGSSPETAYDKDEGPQHKVTIARPFLVSKNEVTFAEWDACYAAEGCTFQPSDLDWGRGNHPVINVSWNDIQLYVKWLSTKTGMPYRLLTEAEWEYAASAGMTTLYSWGDKVGQGNANCDGCKSQWSNKQTAPVGSFKPNAFGLYDMHGNVWEWVQDCYDENGYATAPKDGSAAPDTPNCSRVLRGGSWNDGPGRMRSAARSGYERDKRNNVGFRVARALTPARR
jgi:formylglycine-generating enzyme required for sulfatase activity